jgi:hypothetical protein
MTHNQGFVEPAGASKAFSLHLNGDNYDYVMDYAKTHDVTRNRAVNMLIEEHCDTTAKRARRAKLADRDGDRT